MISKEGDAEQAIHYAKNLIGRRKYQDAKRKIQEAINLHPTIWCGQGMITVCEILHFCQEHKCFPGNTVWPYALLQIPTSSTESEVTSRFDNLRDNIKFLRGKFIGATAAMNELNRALSEYNRNCLNLVDDKKRKAPSTSSDEENTAASESGSRRDSGGGSGGDSCGGGGDDRDDDPYAARSTPEFKKLREHIFATLPQQPHFSPLAKYCASVKQEYDMIFVKLTQKLQNLGGDQILSREEEEVIRVELSKLVQMGYDVKMISERFDMLVRVKVLENEDLIYKEKLKKLENDSSAAMVLMERGQRRLLKVKSEKEAVKAQHYIFKSEIASLKDKLGEGDLCNTVKMDAKD